MSNYNSSEISRLITKRLNIKSPEIENIIIEFLSPEWTDNAEIAKIIKDYFVKKVENVYSEYVLCKDKIRNLEKIIFDLTCKEQFYADMCDRYIEISDKEHDYMISKYEKIIKKIYKFKQMHIYCIKKSIKQKKELTRLNFYEDDDKFVFENNGEVRIKFGRGWFRHIKCRY